MSTNQPLQPVDVTALAQAARAASRQLANAPAAARERALRHVAAAIRAAQTEVLAANARDIAAAEAGAMAPAMVDRLRLDVKRVQAIAAAVEDVAGMPDLIGRVERAETRPNGLQVARMRIPLGVIAIVYESRPNVTVDAAALCLKSGNAVILRGGSEAFHSNVALGRAVADGLRAAELPATAVQVIGSTERQVVKELLAQEEHVDLVIPRGGEGLIRFVSEHSRIPVLKHYKGVCHVYVHAEADLDQALAIAVNSKVQRPSTCNAVETILIDRAVADAFVPRLVERFSELGVVMRGDEGVTALGGERVAVATEADWHAEYLDLTVALRLVDGLEAAIEHIERYGSNHTEAIVTRDSVAGDRFLRECGSSTVIVNASTRFADGGELGLGAEIGVSTTRMHAYGPMGAEGLTTTKFIVQGTGQVRR